MNKNLTVTDVARYLKISRTMVYRFIKNAGLPAEKQANGRYRIELDRLDEWLRG